MILMQDGRKPKHLRFLYYVSVNHSSTPPTPLNCGFKNAKFWFLETPKKHYSYVLILGGREGVKKFTKMSWGHSKFRLPLRLRNCSTLKTFTNYKITHEIVKLIYLEGVRKMAKFLC